MWSHCLLHIREYFYEVVILPVVSGEIIGRFTKKLSGDETYEIRRSWRDVNISVQNFPLSWTHIVNVRSGNRWTIKKVKSFKGHFTTVQSFRIMQGPKLNNYSSQLAKRYLQSTYHTFVPFSTGPGRSWMTNRRLGNDWYNLMQAWPIPPPTSTITAFSRREPHG